ncbi:PTS galactosamine/N-acetylgalactosamine transporter subunit IIA [uncultured Dubosiella sp.]|uniref:PTS galactosamine/N-acetylgalactosamine transporter subunit IIA n=1 Tax=uncultured Dubosiella sp. TaxID=1937011 RepID=UPI00207F847C|nr:PTS galactosamine/N-acetylgalactosamine transporter subunit IIA [uncultured Dubosiella sp.]GJM56486.1 PTS mannose transporter subunit IIA [Erysipelotrichaceae bacterium OPF54]
MATGIIVTGHGRFAEGITSAVDLIAGPQKNYVAVNFEHEVDKLEKDLISALDSLKECSGILIFTDLPGGSPYKTAVLLAQNYDNVEIIAGTNLPMLTEIVMSRSFLDDSSAMCTMAINTGKDMISRFNIQSVLSSTEECTDFSDGI